MERGIRLNNPMNLERNGIAWQGESTLQDDPTFIRFETPEDGIRAGMKNLINYQRLHDLDTIKEIITRYAPPNENDTAAYIADVCARCHVDPDEYFSETDPDHLILLAKAITHHEQGACPDPTLPYWYDDSVYAAAAQAALNLKGKPKMTDASTTTTTPAAANAVLGSLMTNLATIAKNDLLKGLVPVLDGFLTALQNNQGGTVGLLAQVNALGPQLAAALPNVGAQAVKDSAGAAETALNAAAAKAETPNGANG